MNLDAYLSSAPVGGQRVPEIGTSDGFLCFELERRGAEVIALDLPEGGALDLRPPLDEAARAMAPALADGLRQTRNAFWLSHRPYGSRARLVEARAERLPRRLGEIDACFLGNSSVAERRAGRA